MRRALLTAVRLACLCLLAPTGPAAAEDAAALSQALDAAGARDWAAAEAAARRSGPLAVDLILWQRLRAGQGSWPEYRDFPLRHPDWPGLDGLRERAEAAMPVPLPPAEAAAWFADGRMPVSGRGAMAWLQGLAMQQGLWAAPAAASAFAVDDAGPAAVSSAPGAAGAAPAPDAVSAAAGTAVQTGAAGSSPQKGAGPRPALTAAPPPGSPLDLAARAVWTGAAYGDADEQALLDDFGPALAPYHAARVTALLDRGERAAAERTLALLPPGPEADLARARIAVQARRGGVDALILALPPAQQADAGLAMDRFLWRAALKQTQGARDLMIERSVSAEALRDPARWAPLRKDYARAALRAGDWTMAERLAEAHQLAAGGPQAADAADLDWIAGYAALRGGAANRAALHFARMPVDDTGPITRTRAVYWQGRAAEAAGDIAAARALWTQAARDQTAYYGQLAAERVGARMDPRLALSGAALDSLPDWRGAPLLNRDVVQAGIWLAAAGHAEQSQRFMLAAAAAAPPEDIARMARLMDELHRPWDGLRLAKLAAARGSVYPAAYFPLGSIDPSGLAVPPELVLSIARQESEFNHTVASRAGALGLMQVMPDTARMMAQQLALPFERARLTVDAGYNARLGAAYLQGLRGRFGPSVALVAAGYNAGPGRSARWLRDFGDLRRTGPGGADPVDWVEMIPFDETRNYVMRVAESLPVYRARLLGRPVPIVPTWDLRGGGEIPLPARSLLLLALSARPKPTPAWVRDAAALQATGGRIALPDAGGQGGTRGYDAASMLPSAGSPAGTGSGAGAGTAAAPAVPDDGAAGTTVPPAGPAAERLPAASAPAPPGAPLPLGYQPPGPLGLAGP